MQSALEEAAFADTAAFPFGQEWTVANADRYIEFNSYWHRPRRRSTRSAIGRGDSRRALLHCGVSDPIQNIRG